MLNIKLIKQIQEAMMNKTISNKLTDQEILQFNSKTHLKPQNYQDISSLTISSSQVISRQATINIGVVGHVSHGKSTIVEAITGSKTAKHQSQYKNNRTERLGYANAKIFKCPKCPEPSCFQSFPSSQSDQVACKNIGCCEILQLIRHVSFCDCPGHDKFMSTMLTGASVMDAALLLITADMDCPQPQTAQHLSALEIMRIQNIIILQNKIDLVFSDKDKLKRNYKQIKQFVKDSVCKNSPIIPISAQLRYNIDAVLQAICQIPLPNRQLKAPPLMTIIRSFDINKPGSDIDSLKGGVVGGTVLKGVLQVGMEIEIKPGYIYKNQQGNVICTPIKTIITSLGSEKNQLLYSVSGGLIGVGLLIDPYLTRNDKLKGNILGAVNTLPYIYQEITIRFYLMKKLLGSSKTNDNDKTYKIRKIQTSQVLKINVSSCQTYAKVTNIMDDVMTLCLSHPICTDLKQKVAFSRRVQTKFRLIGYGQIIKGKIYKQDYN